MEHLADRVRSGSSRRVGLPGLHPSRGLGCPTSPRLSLPATLRKLCGQARLGPPRGTETGRNMWPEDASANDHGGSTALGTSVVSRRSSRLRPSCCGAASWRVIPPSPRDCPYGPRRPLPNSNGPSWTTLTSARELPREAAGPVGRLLPDRTPARGRAAVPVSPATERSEGRDQAGAHPSSALVYGRARRDAART